MNHHTVSAVSIIGTSLDVLGSLYLAYDLLGGQHGPLRLLTRAVTYSVVFGYRVRHRPGSVVWHSLRNCDRHHTFNRIQPGGAWARSLFVALGRSLFGDPRIWLWSRAISDCGTSIRNRVCPSHHNWPNFCVLSRHAPSHRLCSGSPSSAYTSSTPGNLGPQDRIYCQCLICSTFIHRVENTWAFAIRRRAGDRTCYWHRNDGESLH